MSYRSLIRTRPIILWCAAWLFGIGTAYAVGSFDYGSAVGAAMFATLFTAFWEATGWVSTRVYRALFA